MLRSRRLFLAAFAVVLCLSAVGCGGEKRAGTIKIGVLAACEGLWGYWYDGSLAAAELPLLKRGAARAGSKPADGVKGATVAGKKVELTFGCADDSSEKALSEARRLVETAGVDILVGPTAANEALTIREYARKHPAVTFVNGSSSVQAVTLHNPAPNFFRFSTDGAQWMAGLGAYAYQTLGWRRVVTVGNEWGFSYLQTAGFVAEFCSLGGTIVRQVWTPTGAKAVAEIPAQGVDGFLLTGFADTTLAVAERVHQLEGNLGRRVLGGFLLSESSVVEALGERLAGVVFAQPQDPSARTWTEYVSGVRKAFPGLAYPAITVAPPLYYGAVEAVVQALETVRGDLSGGQRAFQRALAKVELDTPSGRIKLDERHQAIGPNYLLQWQKNRRGKLVPRTIRTVPDVEQTFNGYFRPDGPLLGRDTIECKHGNPPPWAR